MKIKNKNLKIIIKDSRTDKEEVHQYAGGIISAAIDGMKCVKAIVEEIEK